MTLLPSLAERLSSVPTVTASRLQQIPKMVHKRSLTKGKISLKNSSQQKSKNTCDSNVIVRDEIFTRFDKPFGFEQHHANLVWFIVTHSIAAWYCYHCLMGYVARSAFIFETIYGYIGGFGITIACHRYWTHKTFKAVKPLQWIFMVMQTIAVQYPIHKWCMDHRVHHKYSDTDADPTNASRGFWFSHMGWMFEPKHPEVQKKIATFDMSDLENDPVVRFQSKYYYTLTFIFHLLVPVAITRYLFGLPLIYCVGSNYRRYIVSVHFTWLVNSIAHMWGDKPFDKNILPSDNMIVSFFTIGEGWHNYHHTFPWDYKTSEFGWKMNLSTMVIDFCAKMGWIYDLKTVSDKLVNDRRRRTGDGGVEIDDVGIGIGAEDINNNNELVQALDDEQELKELEEGDNEAESDSIKKLKVKMGLGWGEEMIPWGKQKLGDIIRAERIK